VGDWNWRDTHPRLHEFVVDELAAFLTTPPMIEEILAGADRMVDLRDGRAKRKQKFARQKREFIEAAVATQPFLLDFQQDHQPNLIDTHIWSDHKWPVTESELETVKAGPLNRYITQYGDEYEMGGAVGWVKVHCWVPDRLHKRAIIQDFLLPPPLPYSQRKITRPRTRLENLMGLVLVHDSDGDVARIIPSHHDVWERLDNPIWFNGRYLTNQIANDSLVADLRGFVRWVASTDGDIPQAGEEAESAKDDRKPTRREKQTEWRVKALMLRKNNPGMTKTEIASRVGVNPSQLSPRRFPELAHLEEMQKAEKPSGFITRGGSSGQRDVEAISPGGGKLGRGVKIPGSDFFREYCSGCDEPIRVRENDVGTSPLCDDCE